MSRTSRRKTKRRRTPKLPRRNAAAPVPRTSAKKKTDPRSLRFAAAARWSGNRHDSGLAGVRLEPAADGASASTYSTRGRADRSRTATPRPDIALSLLWAVCGKSASAPPNTPRRRRACSEVSCGNSSATPPYARASQPDYPHVPPFPSPVGKVNWKPPGRCVSPGVFFCSDPPCLRAPPLPSSVRDRRRVFLAHTDLGRSDRPGLCVPAPDV
jgi:hypothetical protein